MSTEEDLKNAESEAARDDAEAGVRALEVRSEQEDIEASGEDDAEAAPPIQFGYQRFVYAAYMAFAMFVAFLLSKVVHASWFRLGQWKPAFGEPRDELVYPIAAVIGVGTALYFWRQQSSRQFADEVAEELSKVTWPNKKEVWNSTAVVIFTTLFATLFFALMDQFWKFVTDKIYSF